MVSADERRKVEGNVLGILCAAAQTNGNRNLSLTARRELPICIDSSKLYLIQSSVYIVA